jgi:hypothetical protein
LTVLDHVANVLGAAEPLPAALLALNLEREPA